MGSADEQIRLVIALRHDGPGGGEAGADPRLPVQLPRAPLLPGRALPSLSAASHPCRIAPPDRVLTDIKGGGIRLRAQEAIAPDSRPR